MSGTCVDALNPAGCPAADVLFAAGADGVRLVAFDDPAFFAYAGDLLVSMKVAVVIARESCADDDFGGWASFYAERISPTYWVLGNEPDSGLLSEESWSSWKMSLAQYARFWGLTAPAIRQVQPGATLLVGGLVSGQPSWAGDIAPRLAPAPDGWVVHPYGKNAQETAALLAAYQEVLG